MLLAFATTLHRSIINLVGFYKGDAGAVVFPTDHCRIHPLPYTGDIHVWFVHDGLGRCVKETVEDVATLFV